MKVLLQNLQIFDPQGIQNEKKDLLLEDGIIVKISDSIPIDSGVEKFDFEGAICSPGFFDMHVHLREPGREDEETVLSGATAAAAGGITEIACMPNTTPTIDNAGMVDFIKQKAKGHLVNVHVIAAATKDRKGESISPMYELKESGAVGFSDDGVSIKNAFILRKAMEYSKMLELPIIEHCEDESLAGGAMNESEVSTKLGLPPVPSVAEDLIVMRDILMAEYLDASVHIAHISTKNAVEMVRQAKARGVKVTAEVTPHHFTLTQDSLYSYDTNFKMNPPLRSKEDVAAILEGLKDGTIDVIASDHAPHSPEEKDYEFIYAPNGIIGLETIVGLTLSDLYNKKILSLEKVIEKLVVNPRKILNLPVPKIAEGEKANLSIFNPDLVWTVDANKFKSKSRNTPFDKRIITGKALAAINNGKMFFEDEFIPLSA